MLMKSKEMILAIIALAIAYVIFKMKWIFFDIIEVALILIAAYVIFIFLKKIL